ncbi:MAG TPA: hypothetical protein DCM59_06605 [Clostridium sp.]|nr:hypothetical protein [Clostridium sp.]
MIQSEGPYIISGYCIGGCIAYDMVNILELQGDKVTALIELDHEAFIKKNTYKYVYYNILTLKLIELWRKICKKNKMYTMKKFMDINPFKCVVSKERQADILKDKEKLKNFLGRELMIKSNYYSLGFISTPVVVIKAKENYHKLLNKGCWRKILRGNLEYYEVSGNHETVLQSPNVEKVAEIIKEYLKKIEIK